MLGGCLLGIGMMCGKAVLVGVVRLSEGCEEDVWSV